MLSCSTTATIHVEIVQLASSAMRQTCKINDIISVGENKFCIKSNYGICKIFSCLKKVKLRGESMGKIVLFNLQVFMPTWFRIEKG